MVLDIIFIALIALCIFAGYKRGLVKVAFKVCAFLLAIIITLVLYRPITDFVIKNTDIDEKIENIIIENGTIQDNKTSEENTENKETNVIVNYMNSYVKETAENTQNGIVTSVAKTVSINVVGIIVMIALFIVSRLLINILKTLADTIANLPIIKQFNKLGGVIYGLLEGFLIVYVVLAIMFFIISVNGASNLLEMIQKSMFTQMMYNNNIVLKVLFK